MILKYVVPVISLVMVGFAAYHVVGAREDWLKSSPPVEPPHNPFPLTVAGAGVLEAQTQNIAIGSPVPGVVVEVLVQVGQRVAAGDPLFRIDDRHPRAELSVRQAGLDLARAELERLENLPRQDQVPVTEAAVVEAEAQVAEQQYQLTRIRELLNKAAASPDELNSCERALDVAKARLARARAELDLLKAGSWEYDKAIVRATVAQAKTQVEQGQTELDRLVVRAQVAGQVLQVNLRPGEFVGAPAGQALIVLGNIDLLHVRVDIDEYDIPRFRSGAPAKAMLKGSPQEEFPLRFVRVEPFVIPKRALTGENTERVDTRVLQVIYTIEVKRDDLYVGQQLDVFIDAGSPPAQGADLTPAT